MTSRHDAAVATAVNMPRGHHDDITTRWPARGRKCGQLLEELLAEREEDNPAIVGLVVAFAEFPTRALAPLRAEGVRLSRGAANFRDQHDAIGNAHGWLGDLRLVDHHRIDTLPFVDHPHGRVVMHQPVRLYRTPRGGSLAVIAEHTPTVGNIDAPQDYRGDRGRYPHLVREQLAADVCAYARRCVEAGHTTLVVGDLNNSHEEHLDRGAVTLAAADVQRVLGFGDVEATGRGVLDTHPAISDHRGGSPYAVVKVPALAAGRARKLPR